MSHSSILRSAPDDVLLPAGARTRPRGFFLAALVIVPTLAGCAQAVHASTATVDVPSISSLPAPSETLAVSVIPHAPEAACLGVTMPAMHHIIFVDSDHMTRAVMPAIRAACACTESGSRTRLVVDVTPSQGIVLAHAPDAPAIDGCITNVIDGHFQPFSVPSDELTGEPPHAGESTIRYPFFFVHPPS